jgi:hypothetical protein
MSVPLCCVPTKQAAQQELLRGMTRAGYQLYESRVNGTICRSKIVREKGTEPSQHLCPAQACRKLWHDVCQSCCPKACTLWPNEEPCLPTLTRCQCLPWLPSDRGWASLCNPTCRPCHGRNHQGRRPAGSSSRVCALRTVWKDVSLEA